jgi:hypothetical protein
VSLLSGSANAASTDCRRKHLNSTLFRYRFHRCLQLSDFVEAIMRQCRRVGICPGNQLASITIHSVFSALARHSSYWFLTGPNHRVHLLLTATSTHNNFSVPSVGSMHNILIMSQPQLICFPRSLPLLDLESAVASWVPLPLIWRHQVPSASNID